MAKARPEKEREKKNEADGQPALPGVHGAAPFPSKTTRVLPVQLQVGDLLIEETGEYEVIGRPYTTDMGKTFTCASGESITPR